MGDSTIGPKANPAVKVVMPIEAATTLTFHSDVSCCTAGPYEPTAKLDNIVHVHEMAVTRTLRQIGQLYGEPYFFRFGGCRSAAGLPAVPGK